MKFDKPDGVIEISNTGCCCPPGENRGGQHTNASSTWWRINAGDWQLCGPRTSQLLQLAREAQSCAEFEERWMEIAKPGHEHPAEQRTGEV